MLEELLFIFFTAKSSLHNLFTMSQKLMPSWYPKTPEREKKTCLLVFCNFLTDLHFQGKFEPGIAASLVDQDLDANVVSYCGTWGWMLYDNLVTQFYLGLFWANLDLSEAICLKMLKFKLYVSKIPNSTISLKQNCFKQRELQALVIHQWRLHRCHRCRQSSVEGNAATSTGWLNFPNIYIWKKKVPTSMCFPQKMSCELKRSRNPIPMILWFSSQKKSPNQYLKLETQLLGTVKGPGSESGWPCWMSQHFLNVKHRQSWKDAWLKTHQNTELDHSNWWIQNCLEFWKLQMQSTMAVTGSVTHLFS